MILMIGVAQVGLGRWGQNIFRNLNELEEVSVKYGCDSSRAVLEKIKGRYPQVQFTQNFSRVLKDPAVKAVFIATPSQSHYRLALQALKAGKHVFVEKPITLKSSQAKQLVLLAKKKKLKLMVGHLLVHHPAMAAIKNLLKKKKIGRILFFNFRRTNLGVFRKSENALWDASVHDLATLLYLLGGEMPVKVNCEGKASFRKNIEEIVFTHLTFKNGLKAFLLANWLDPFKLRQTIIVGEAGMIVLDEHDEQAKLKIYKKRAVFNVKIKDFEYCDEGAEAVPCSSEEPLKRECQNFIEGIGGKTILTDGLSGFKVLKILEAAQKSLKNNGIPIKLR